MKLGMAQLFLLVILDDDHGQLHQLIRKGNQHNGSDQIENRLEIRDISAVHTAHPEFRREHRQLPQNSHQKQEQNRSDGIERDVDDARPLGVLGRADGADHGRGDAGAQIDAHDDRIGHGESDPRPRHRCHRLEHTNRRRRALDNDRQDKAKENAEQGIIQEPHKGNKRVRTHQRLHAAGHQVQTYKQDAEADADIADGIGALGLNEHQQHNADDKSDRRKRVRVEQPQQPASVGLNGAETDDLCRDGCADIGAHDDGHGLPQIQHARANQGDRQNDGSGGALDHGGDQRARENAHHNISGDLFQHAFQCGAGAVFQAVAHQLDAVQEQGKSAQKLHDGT